MNIYRYVVITAIALGASGCGLGIVQEGSAPAATAPRAAAVAAGPTVVKRTISKQQVLDAQQAWCQALVDIGAAYRNRGRRAARTLAEQVIDGAYGYQMGTVLFKPTLTVNPQTFRTTRAGALAYFVGGDPAFPEDTGFALLGWRQCEVDNAALFISGNGAATMAKVHLTGADGTTTTVDKTWGFIRDDDGALRIVVHHSSLEHENP